VLIDVVLLPLRREEENSRKRRPTTLRRTFLLDALPSGASVATSLPLSDLPRGCYTVQELRLIGSDVLGLFRVLRRVTAASDGPAAAGNKGVAPDSTRAVRAGKDDEAAHENRLIVGPAILAVPGASGSLRAGANLTGAQATKWQGHSDEMRGTRHYTPGDDLRFVHWKSTARKGELVVKEFHHVTQERSVVVWDGSAGTTWGRDDTTTEWGLRLVASICHALHASGQAAALLRLDSNPLLIGDFAYGHRSSMTPDRVAEALADADAERETPLGDAISGFPQAMLSDGSIYLVTASVAPEVAQTVTRWRARGSQVIVALIDGLSFQDSGAGRHGNATPVTKRPAHEPALTPATFKAQIEALQAVGAYVVVVETPAGQTPHAFARPLRASLQRILKPQGRSATSTNTSQSQRDAALASPGGRQSTGPEPVSIRRTA
jgi:hypothetical protein